MNNAVLLIETRPEINTNDVFQKHTRYLPKNWIKLLRKDIPDFTFHKLNTLLTSFDFWNGLHNLGIEKVLTIQHDSQLLREGIEEFMEWDMVGAPHTFCDWTVNGGLSLRTVSIMKTVCEKHIYHGESKDGNEDLWFSNILHYHPQYGKLAPRYVCSRFSCEAIFALGTLGEHSASRYLSATEYEQIINQYK